MTLVHVSEDTPVVPLTQALNSARNTWKAVSLHTLTVEYVVPRAAVLYADICQTNIACGNN
jgi:hypothetical protein